MNNSDHNEIANQYLDLVNREADWSVRYMEKTMLPLSICATKSEIFASRSAMN